MHGLHSPTQLIFTNGTGKESNLRLSSVVDHLQSWLGFKAEGSNKGLRFQTSANDNFFPLPAKKLDSNFVYLGPHITLFFQALQLSKKPELSLCCEVAFNTPRMFFFVLVVPQHLLEGIFYTAHMSRLFLTNEIFVWSGHLACWDDDYVSTARACSRSSWFSSHSLSRRVQRPVCVGSFVATALTFFFLFRLLLQR